MNVYDFDQTVYYPDSSYHFFLYCLKRFPLTVIPTLPKSLVMALKYRKGTVDAKALKQQLFSYLCRLKEIDRIVIEFWDGHACHMLPWYLEQKREDDVIVSASPEFLLRPMAQRLGVSLIGTRMDSRSGRIDGNNCHDEEKVRRFREEYPRAEIDAFYSDSRSDAPMARMAKTSFLVRKDTLDPWPNP